MNIELKFATSFTINDSIDDKYLSHGQLNTPYGTLCMICNGFGDSRGGVLASSIAFEIIRRIVTSIPGRSAEKLLNSAIREANKAIYKNASSNMNIHKTGCELIALLIDTDEMQNALICRVGSSRLYRIWDDNITQITKGHYRFTEKSEQRLADGEGSRSHSENRVQVCSIGIREEIEPEIRKIFVQENDRYIICTRGVTDHISDTEIAQLYEANAQKYADNILQCAGNHGSKNNPVVQIIDINSSSESGREKNKELTTSNQRNRSE